MLPKADYGQRRRSTTAPWAGIAIAAFAVVLVAGVELTFGRAASASGALGE